MREALVKAAESRGIELRQSYRRLSKRALIKQSSYAHAQQMKRARRMTGRLKTYLGRGYRDISRKALNSDDELKGSNIAGRLLSQERNSKNKIYSVHAPEVGCICKGKAHKRYEFGCPERDGLCHKVSMVTSSKGNWILAIEAVHGNPYDGHTLESILDQVKENVGWQPGKAHVDRGYCGHGYEGETEIEVVDYRRVKKRTRWARMWMKRRSAIEPIFGHLKSGNRLDRNYLKGKEGDKINALLSGCGFNMRRLLRAFFLPVLEWVSERLKRLFCVPFTKNSLSFSFT